MATSSGTWGYRDRFDPQYGRTFFRRYGPGVVASVGAGTYLGAPTDAVDERYRAALTTALEHGCNVLDTAVNYRCGRSERVVGDALDAVDVPREAALVCTKGGFLPFDGSRPEDPGRYVREQFVEPGLVDPVDLARGSHCIAPEFLDAMLDRSLGNLGVDAVDLYYVHNPETQLAERSRAEVYDQLEDAFALLERKVEAGTVGGYGVATWEAFRVDAGDDDYLSLPEVVSRAEAAADRVGADEHSLRAIQLPFNVHMADAFTVRSHDPADGPDEVAARFDGGEAGTDDAPISALEYAHEAGLGVFTSASVLQGDLAEGVPEDVASVVAGDTPVQRAINFARSAPGVTCALVGMGRVEHVREDLAAGTFDPLGAGAFDAVFE